MHDEATYLRLIVDELQRAYGCHTVLLYGSRARGDATDSSDWDVLGVRDHGDEVHDARAFEGGYLDGFAQGEETLAKLERGALKLRGARVLCEREGYGAALLARVDAFYTAGPPTLTREEERLARDWPRRMLERAARGDIEGNYRRLLVLAELLESYFALRGRWYLGSKASFAWLAEHDAASFDAFDRALAPGAPLATLEALIERVMACPATAR